MYTVLLVVTNYRLFAKCLRHLLQLGELTGFSALVLLLSELASFAAPLLLLLNELMFCAFFSSVSFIASSIAATIKGCLNTG